MKGRKPTPRALKLLRGNPSKRPLSPREPQPCPDSSARASWLSGFAAEEWDRIAPELVRLGLLTVVDRGLLEAYCASYGRWRDLEARIARMSLDAAQKAGLLGQAQKERMLLQRLGVEFGFTPSSRSRVKTEPPAKDENERFFG
jgi:P27 family predicted phage terminase small subunit